MEDLTREEVREDIPELDLRKGDVIYRFRLASGEVVKRVRTLRGGQVRSFLRGLSQARARPAEQSCPSGEPEAAPDRPQTALPATVSSRRDET